MNIYQKIVLEILKFLEKMDNDEEFKKTCPDITAAEYLIAKANPDIKPQRLINILSGKTKRITLHTLRHTFGSTLLRHGVGIEVISKLMGHSNITITYNKYIHAIQEEEAKAMTMIRVC